MLDRIQGVQSVAAPGFVPVVQGVEGGMCFTDGVACRHRPSEIVHNAP